MNGQHLSNRVSALQPSIIRDMFSRRRPTSLDLSLGEPSTPTQADVLDRALAALRSGPQGYTDNAGLPAVREAIAKYYAIQDRARAENVIVTVGSEEAVFLSMMCTLDVGDEVLIPEPGYPAYRNIARMLGVTPVSYSLTRATGLVARADAIAPKISPRTRLLILNSPSNPFGTIDESAELERIARLVESAGITVLSDEIYGELIYRSEPVSSICRMTPRSILVSGLSKSCSMTGLRLGFMIAEAPFVKQAILAHQMMVTCAPRIAQLAALEVFKEPQRLKAFVPHYEETRRAMQEAAKSLPEGVALLLGEGAFYAILDISRYANGDPMRLAIDLLEQEDVVVVPGNAFGAGGEWFWRISYAAGAETVREGFLRIARFLGTRTAHAPAS